MVANATSMDRATLPSGFAIGGSEIVFYPLDRRPKPAVQHQKLRLVLICVCAGRGGAMQQRPHLAELAEKRRHPGNDDVLQVVAVEFGIERKVGVVADA